MNLKDRVFFESGETAGHFLKEAGHFLGEITSWSKKSAFLRKRKKEMEEGVGVFLFFLS